MSHRRMLGRGTILSAAFVLALVAAACGGGGDDDGGDESPTAGADATSTGTTSASPTTGATTAAATATSAPTLAPSPTPGLAFNQAKLLPALMPIQRVNTVIGSNIQTLRDKAQDPQLPFSSVPSMGNTLVAQGVQLLFNSYQTSAAPPQGRPFAFQNTAQGYPSSQNAANAFNALKTAWQGNLFTNLSQQGDLGSAWSESFCQVGTFTSTTSGQQTQWYVCMARLGPYIMTVSIGGFPGLDVNSLVQPIRSYFDDASRTF